MHHTKVELLSDLLRELEADVGTSDLCELVLYSLKEAVRSLKVKNNDEFREQFKKLALDMSQTKPKFGILNYYLHLLMYECLHIKHESHDCKKSIIQKIDAIAHQTHKNRDLILDFGERIDIENKTILIHDHSHTVHNLLKKYRTRKHHFKIIVAEQDYQKTHQNIEVLHDAKIPFQVVPDYMLSHIHNSVDMVFFGALTLKDTMDFVMDPGAYGIVSQFHTMNIPVYLFIDTTKFSLWKSEKKHEIFFHRQKRIHHTKAIEYERLKYSHDRVPAKLFYRIVTNEGIFSPEETEKLFQKKLKAYEKSGLCDCCN